LVVRRMEYTSGDSVMNYTKKNTQGLPGVWKNLSDRALSSRYKIPRKVTSISCRVSRMTG